MTLLKQSIPTIDQALELSVEELAYAVLRHLQPAGRAPLHAGNRVNDLVNSFDPELHERKPQPERKDEFRVAIAEALSWLNANGLTAITYDANYTNLCVTRKGMELRTDEAFRNFQKTTTIKREALHPILQGEAWLAFVRGKFDHATFEAFKQVEVAVRSAGAFTDDDFGVPLMRAAFKKGDGPLSDTRLPENEQDAISHLFSGAMGALKNPGSHRFVGLTEATRAAELLMFASYLLRLVDDARARTTS